MFITQMLAQYTAEQSKLEDELKNLQGIVAEYERELGSADKFIALVRKYANFEVMTNTMLNKFEYKILVHEQYLRRKSTGWQATYYWKNKRARKEKMDAAKEAIRAEDQAKGIYYHPKQRKEQINEKNEEFTTVDA